MRDPQKQQALEALWIVIMIVLMAAFLILALIRIGMALHDQFN
jgi:hypothetical protein